MNDKTPTVEELIEMLTILKKQIKPHLSPARMTTLIVDVYPDSAEFVISETIEHLRRSVNHEKNPHTV